MSEWVRESQSSSWTQKYKFLQLPSPRGCLRRWPPTSGICVGQRVKREREGCVGLSCAVGLQPSVSASAKGVKSEREGFRWWRGRGRGRSFWFSFKRFFVLICGCKSYTNNCTGAIKFKNQNYVPNTIFFFFKLWFQLWNQNYVPNKIFFTILNSNQDSSSNFNKVKNHETKTKNENTYQTGP